jgi:hypothetical protein
MMALEVQVDQAAALKEMVALGAQEILLQPHHHKEMPGGLQLEVLLPLVAVVVVLDPLAAAPLAGLLEMVELV